MRIIENGVELDTEEFMRFFNDHGELDRMVYWHEEMAVGDITTVTNDNRLVIDVDMPCSVPLYSAQYSIVAVVRNNDDGNYAVSIVR